MKLPNAVSVAVIVAVIALCQGLADTLPVLGQPWVPFAIVALGALVKGLQVYLEERKAAPTPGDVTTLATPERKSLLRQVLLD
jgi:hypothetical protein